MKIGILGIPFNGDGMSVSCYHPNLDTNLEAASRFVGMLGSALSSGE